MHLAFPQRLLLGAMLCCAPYASADVFINELHYDNDGTDTNERVEIAAPAGTSLSGWRIDLYNGSGGAVYASHALSGTVGSQCGSHGVVSVSVAGIQNGSPDGLALINASGQVVQFLSYEGTFTATGGAANGQTSVNIGVSETTTTPAGRSLQLSGSGASAAQFSWQAPATSSFGACNAGQSFSGGGTPDPDPDPEPIGNELVNGVAVLDLAAPRYGEVRYTIVVPAGASDLIIASSGGSGDADLYVRFGQAPDTGTWDCRPYDSGSNETCSFANPAAGTWHVMLRAYSAFSGVDLLAEFTPADGGGGDPGGYYTGVVTSSSSALRSSLHAVIDDHTKIPYTASSTDTWDVLDQADQDPLNPSRVLDIYANTSFAKAGGGNTQYNREHTWPKSLGFPDDGASNYPHTDLHMLMISEIDYNAARGNLPFGDCTSSCTEYPTQAYASQGGGSGTFPGNSNWSNGSVWQVWTRLKGNVARAMFYMDLRYEGGTHGGSGTAEPDLRLTDNLSLVTMSSGNASVAYMGRLSTLLAWHAADPVTEAERLRNQIVQTYQGNRNPFVDHPEWVACIYQNVCP